jgi:hypothetical protein
MYFFPPRNYILCRYEKLNGRENSTQVIVHNSVEDISPEASIENINIILHMMGLI